MRVVTAITAYRAQWALLADPAACARMAARKVSIPKIGLNRDEYERLVAALDSGSFPTREKAHRALAELGGIKDWLRESSRQPSSPEVQRRLKELLDRASDPLATPDGRRIRRLVHTLELARNKESTELLRTWSKGARGALLTEEARTTMKRLADEIE